MNRGASNSQGPSTRPKDPELQLLRESQVDTWKLQGLT